MNIKGIASQLVPIELKKIDLRRTRNSPDRDPQQGGSGSEEKPTHQSFSESELEEALKILRELPGVKVNNLQFRVERSNDRVVVFLEDPTGKIIRRIPDTELRLMVKNHQPNSPRGNLLNKSL